MGRIVVEAMPTTRLRKRSEIMVEKLAAPPRERLRQVIGRVDDGTLRAVERALLLVLGFGASWCGCVNQQATYDR